MPQTSTRPLPSRTRCAGLLALAAAVVLGPIVACASSTSPGGAVELTRNCVTLDVTSGMGECGLRLTTVAGGGAVVNAVTLIGAGGQPVGAGFAYGGNLGLRFYSDPTPGTLAGQSVGAGGLEFVVRAVISVGDGETTPPPGSLSSAVRVRVTPAGGAEATLEVPVTIRIL